MPLSFPDKIAICIVGLIITGINVTLIVLGSVYLNDCPGQSLLPIWLIVDGIYNFAFIISSLFLPFNKRRMGLICTLKSIFLWVLSLGLFTTVQEFDHDRQVTEIHHGLNFCNLPPYWAIWLVYLIQLECACSLIVVMLHRNHVTHLTLRVRAYQSVLVPVDVDKLLFVDVITECVFELE